MATPIVDEKTVDQAEVNACIKEIEDTLKKHDCRIRVFFMLSELGNKQQVLIEKNPKAETPVKPATIK